MKKIIGLVTVLALCLCGCTREARVGLAGFAKRLSAQDERFAFDTRDVTLSGGNYQVEYDFTDGDRVLMQLSEGSDKRIRQVQLTAAQPYADTELLTAFIQSVTAVFCQTDTTAGDWLTQAEINSQSLFTETHTQVADGRYSLTFYSTSLCVSVIWAYDDSELAETTELPTE